ncbi:FAD-dependent thymidylate synthase [Candidatus Bipolaricaulota bacterium]|nr:FAD-dependent thymidylate synthase [Candidatus Bipolaricaulota bacterium]
MEVRLIAATQCLDQTGPEELLERAGRLCYASAMGDTAKFLRARVREGHLSLIEHATASFYIGGISRTCSHQLVRHRLCSFSQRSQRYVSEGGAEFIVPLSIAQNEEASRVYQNFLASSREAYTTLRELGVPKEDSRFVLPNATETELIMSLNFREALHLFRVRISRGAQWEIREVCARMLDQLSPIAPSLFGELLDELKGAHPEWFRFLPQQDEVDQASEK